MLKGTLSDQNRTGNLAKKSMPKKRIIATEARVFKGETISNLRKQSCEEPEQWTWAMESDGGSLPSLPPPPPPCAREDDSAAADPHVILDLCEGDGMGGGVWLRRNGIPTGPSNPSLGVLIQSAFCEKVGIREYHAGL